LAADLREDRQYLIDHPGATPITTAQAGHFYSIFLTKDHFLDGGIEIFWFCFQIIKYT